jgi:hypothetical protein
MSALINIKIAHSGGKGERGDGKSPNADQGGSTGGSWRPAPLLCLVEPCGSLALHISGMNPSRRTPPPPYRVAGLGVGFIPGAVRRRLLHLIYHI